MLSTQAFIFVLLICCIFAFGIGYKLGYGYQSMPRNGNINLREIVNFLK